MSSEKENKGYKTLWFFICTLYKHSSGFQSGSYQMRQTIVSNLTGYTYFRADFDFRRHETICEPKPEIVPNFNERNLIIIDLIYEML